MTATVEWHGDEVLAKLRKAHAAALSDVAEVLLEGANRTVPIEEMILGGSGTVVDLHGGTIARSSGGPNFVTTRVDTARPTGLIELAVSYDTPYAVVQHEDTSLNHDPGRRAKWLELELVERRTDFEGYVARKLKAAVAA